MSQIIDSSLLFSIAYKMLGTVAHAEDIVQEVQLSLLAQDQEQIEDLKNYSIRSTINKCLTAIEQEKRMEYPGIWLPEPLSPSKETQFQKLATADQLSYEFVHLLQQLNPKERAVFVLRSGFDYKHGELALLLDLTEAQSRQLFKRAKAKVRACEHGGASAKQLDLAREYVQLISEAKLDELIELFKADIRLLSDGGGKVVAAKVPIDGAQKVAMFLGNIAQQAAGRIKVEIVWLMHQPVVKIFMDGECTTVQLLSIHNNRITHIYTQRNPDKLLHFQKS